MLTIHPEIALGFKSYGEDRLPQAIEVMTYPELNPDEVIPNKIQSAANQIGRVIRQLRPADFSRDLSRASVMFSIIKQVITEKKFFVVGKDFFSALKNVNINIPTNLLPERAAGYVYASRFHEEDGASNDPGRILDYTSFYYRIETFPTDECRTLTLVILREMMCNPERKPDRAGNKDPGKSELEKKIQALKPFLREASEDEKIAKEVSTFISTAFVTVFQVKLEDKQTIQEAFDRAAENKFYMNLKPNELLPRPVDALRKAVNCILYIHSQQPDLQKAVPDVGLSHGRKKSLADRGIATSELTIPVTYVSWNYQKPVMHNVDSSFVETHPRWQPCGPNRSQVKLIWVKEHTRRYKNVKAKKDGTSEETTLSRVPREVLHVPTI